MGQALKTRYASQAPSPILQARGSSSSSSSAPPDPAQDGGGSSSSPPDLVQDGSRGSVDGGSSGSLPPPSNKIPRAQLFLTSKIHPRHLGYLPTLSAFQASLDDLGTDYLDLLLLHYPLCWGSLCGGEQPEVSEGGPAAAAALPALLGQLV